MMVAKVNSECNFVCSPLGFVSLERAVFTDGDYQNLRLFLVDLRFLVEALKLSPLP